jgi:ATP-binding cassette subfamily B protein
MKKYTPYIKPYLFFFIVGPIMMLTEVFGEVWIPRLMSMIINNGVANHDIAYILRIGLLMLGACLIMIIGGVLGGYFSVRSAVGFTGDLRRDLFAKVQTFSFADLDDFSTGSLVTRLTNDLQQIQMMVMMTLRMALRSPGMLVGGPNSHLEDPYAQNVLSGLAPALCYADNEQSYSTNEVAVYWNSPLIALLADMEQN